MHLRRSTRRDSPFLEGHGAFVCDQDPALTVRIRALNRGFKFGGLQVSLGSLAALHVADVTEAPAARNVDGVAPLVTSEGSWAATWAGNLDAARAASASGLVMLCHSDPHDGHCSLARMASRPRRDQISV